MIEIEKKEFIYSALSNSNELHDNEEIQLWIKKNRNNIAYKIEAIPLDNLENWYTDIVTGNIHHITKRFFSIEGVRASTNYGPVKEWDQPIIIQPEVGYLGFVCKKFNGLLHFLVQAKVEPGNINGIQLAPTLQATKSNYTGVHKGKAPEFINLFRDANKKNVILDVLQSEQGSRYLKKRNRNIVVLTERDIDLTENFIWMTLGQITKLLREDNLVNMDTRTVLSCIPFGRYVNNGLHNRSFLEECLTNNNPINDLYSILSWITDAKCRHELTVNNIPLKNVNKWIRSEYQINHSDNKYFRVIGVNSRIYNREISSWCQPLIQSLHSGIICFIVKRINSTIHFLVHAKLEVGNFDVIELAPTVQCINDDYKISKESNKPAFLDFVIRETKNYKTLYDKMQSEEGGRFFHETHRNMIILVDENFSTEVPIDYLWLTLDQIKTLIMFNNYFNMEARSLVSAIGACYFE